MRRLWRGEMRLPISFWLYGVVAGTALSQIAFRLNIVRPPRAAWIDVAAPAATFIAGIYLLFVAIAIWRSASRYAGPRVWPIAAKLSIAAVVAIMLAHTAAELLG